MKEIHSRRRFASPLVLVALAGGLSAVAPSPTAAQQGASIWPEHAENLKVLPEDFPPQRLRAVMRGFALALGVRCEHCHVGEAGQPLSTFDFASDDNPNKDRAREMYRMLGVINARLKDFGSSSPDHRVNMWCHTCHNGKPRPQTLAEVIQETYDTEGADEAVARFGDLRSRFYGAAAYDFTAPSVNALASGFFQAGDTATALRFFERNVQDFPDFAEGWESLGDVAAATGDRATAIGYYEKAVALAPDNRRIRASLEKARAGG